MTSPRPSAPPPSARPDVTDRERLLVEQVVGPVAGPDDLRALRDARGRTFQRLEFLGDSLLDLVLAVHVWVEPGCPTCSRASRPADPGRLVTDRRLAAQARSAGLGEWLEWEASDDRLADLVEAVAAVAWRGGGWPALADTTDRLVHPTGPATTAALAAGGRRPAAAAGSGAARHVGSALLELAAALEAFGSLPDADEGALSRRRALRHRAEVVAGWARRTGQVRLVGDAASISDRVERLLSDVLLREGAAAALREAAAVLGGDP